MSVDQKAVWDNIHSRMEWITSPSMEFLAFMAEYYWGCSDLEILDLGAGAGTNALYLADKGFKITAVEISEAACDRILSHQFDQIEIINSNVMDVDFDPAKFDCILNINILECIGLADSCLLARRMKKWLKPNGRVLARALAQPIPEPINHEGIDIHIYTARELIEQIFKDFEGHLRIDSRYFTDKFLQVTNWTFHGKI